jgi:drug/metabolite transporter (DMT)-like permease
MGQGDVDGARSAVGSWVGLGLLAAAWGSTFLWIDVALSEGVSPAVLTVGRALVATVALAAVGWPRFRSWGGNGPRPRDLLLASALCNAMPFLCVSIAQQTVSSGIAGVLSVTTPLWAVLLESRWGRRELIRGRQFAGVAVGFVGVCLLSEPWRGHVSWSAGVVLLLAAAAGYAAGFVFMVRRLIPTAAAPAELATLQMFAATLLLAIPAGVSGDYAIPTLTGALAVVVIGLVCTAFTFTIAYRMLASEGATRTAVVGYVIPVVAVLLGALVLSEQLRPLAFVGIGVVLAGVALTRSSPADRALAGQP